LLAAPPDLSALKDGQAWEAAKENAGRYGVAALVAFTVRSHVSAGEREWCDRILARCWIKHERMLSQLEDLTILFESAGIRTIALKGPALALRYYDPPFLRKSSMDLDFAVAREDLARASDLLMAAGYRLEVPIQEAVLRSHHLELVHPSRPKIELHFRLSHMSRGIAVNEFFDRAIPFLLPSGREIKVLGPADQLLHLMLHLAQSRFGTLFHLTEVRRVRNAEPLPVVEEAVRRAIDGRYCGVLRMMDIAFRVRWGEPFLPSRSAVPPTWLDWRLNRQLYADFEHWSVPGRKWTPATRLWGRWLDLQITDSLADAARSLLLLIQAARFHNARKVWRTIRNVSYGPDFSSTRPPEK
jgi:hypothetical protein